MTRTRIPPWVAERVKAFLQLPQTPVSLHQMTQFGHQPSPLLILRGTQFMREELAVRIAHRVAELENLPHELSSMPSVVRVSDWYSQSLQDLAEFPAPEEYDIPPLLLDNRREKIEELLNAPTPVDSPYLRSTISRSGPHLGNHGFLRGIFGTGAAPHPPTVQSTPAEVVKKAHNLDITSANSLGVTTKASVKGRYYNPLPPEVNLSDIPPQVTEYNAAFLKCVETIKRRHDPVVSTIAYGVLELKEHWRRTSSPLINPQFPRLLPAAVQSFLDRFYMSRIGIRMLIGQHIALSQASMSHSSNPEDHVGIICTRTSIREVASHAIEDARSICRDYFGLYTPPTVDLVMPKGKSDVEFMYIPSHLHHMLFELLKNSLRATVERFGPDAEDEWPVVKVIVAEGERDITVKVQDEGGGIPRSGMPLVWTYMYTTASTPMLEEDYNRNDFNAPLAGFGYGLPLSRLYARYFGGDLKLICMEGYGTDAYLHLSRLADSPEPLP
ncbi:alpha-ketoacid dehydrogenase kinase [Gonapodya prolifera JEL478]|uniref:Protein-serine/threonine kinase n=1 Tax=Gonapodya prolifera (strain JEL478) TaxID=1344416 RepID=A0A139AHI1_GONPJ|nr:alpha-ketoacid dehydrogenase kinase [Gonapodya prolifera JEL478]|eukprot:KXS16257.1 alpha-ketoacid dehydrogenase kinase [Gonapodya prolifera JEL478]